MLQFNVESLPLKEQTAALQEKMSGFSSACSRDTLKSKRVPKASPVGINSAPVGHVRAGLETQS